MLIDKESFCRALVRGVSPQTAEWLWRNAFGPLRGPNPVTPLQVVGYAVATWGTIPPLPWCRHAAWVLQSEPLAGTAAHNELQSRVAEQGMDFVRSHTERCTKEFFDRLLAAMDANPFREQVELEGINLGETYEQCRIVETGDTHGKHFRGKNTREGARQDTPGRVHAKRGRPKKAVTDPRE